MNGSFFHFAKYFNFGWDPGTPAGRLYPKIMVSYTPGLLVVLLALVIFSHIAIWKQEITNGDFLLLVLSL